MSNLKFCIIMPCYNSALYVKDAIDSLINQTYENWNLIAINDGSTDNTFEILNEYALTDKRVKVFSKKNGGYSSAINYGLDRVSGDYFLMMGSDDRLSSDLFSEIIKHVKNDNLPDMIGFRAMKYCNGVPYEIDGVSNFETTAYMANSNINEFEKTYPKHSKILFIRDTAKCFKTSLLGELRYFGEYGFDADGVFSSLFLHKCRSFLCVPIFGYLWTKREDSVSATINKNKNIDRIKVWGNYVSALNRYGKTELTVQEEKYIFYTIKVSIELLNSKNKLSWRDHCIMNSAMIKSFHFAKKNDIDLGIYALPKNSFKKIIFSLCPVLFLKRYGFVIG